MFVLFAPVQASGSDIIGIVHDQDGQFLDYANIVLLKGSVSIAGAMSLEGGYFRIKDMAAGEYTLKILYLGFVPLSRSIQILPGRDLRLVLQLKKSKRRFEQDVCVLEGPPPLNELFNATAEDTGEPQVDETTLGPNVPNPFNPSTRIAFKLARAGRVRLRVFDLAGREIETLVDDLLPAGGHSVEWAGQDKRGQGVSSGIYLYRLQTEHEVFSRKMLLAK